MGREMIPQWAGRYNAGGGGFGGRLVRSWYRTSVILLLCGEICAAAAIQAIRVENLAGAISVQPSPNEQATVRFLPASSRSACREEILEDSGTLQIKCPEGGAAVRVEVDLPIGTPFAGVTKEGAISFSGLSRMVSLSTDTGDLRIATPWSMVRLAGFSLVKPKRISSQRGIVVRTFDQPRQWLIAAGKTPSPEAPLEGAFFGEIRIRGGSPGRLDLEDLPVPRHSWVKPPSEAASLLAAWLKRVARREGRVTAAAPPSLAEGPGVEAGLPVFSADVRLVSLTVAVTGPDGHPVAGLKPDDFEVLESGTRQTLVSARSEGVPFNLALLLDLSGSTKGYRESMKEVARRFIGIARERDKVAVYALGNSLFYVVSRLSSDRTALLDKIDAIPEVEGQTPLYDSIFLSCAEEFLEDMEQRNALIVISDGIDSSLGKLVTSGRSLISPGSLRDAAARMNVLIYPVLTGTDDWPLFSAAARRNLSQVAQASGGRVFEAKSIEAMEPVYEQVAEELRSVYTLAYYPANQNFDGRWRRIQVRLKQPGLRLRTREGYFAW